MSETLSQCCHAPVTVSGERSTHYYVCGKCGKACDVSMNAAIAEKCKRLQRLREKCAESVPPIYVVSHPKEKESRSDQWASRGNVESQEVADAKNIHGNAIIAAMPVMKPNKK